MKLRHAVIASAMGVAMAASPLVASANFTMNSFNKKQQDDIKAIVKEYLVQNPEILLEVSKALQAKQQQAMMQKATQAIDENGEALFNTQSPAIGNLKGDVTLVEFFDYQCVHCKKMAPVIKGLVDKNSNLRVVYKEFPIFGKSSMFAAEAALAAQMQGKYEALHQALIGKKQHLTPAIVLQAADSVGINTAKLKVDMKSDTVQKALAENRALAEQLHLMGTPAFIIASTPQGSYQKGNASFFVPGAASPESLGDFIAKAAADASNKTQSSSTAATK